MLKNLSFLWKYKNYFLNVSVRTNLFIYLNLHIFYEHNKFVHYDLRVLKNLTNKFCIGFSFPETCLKLSSIIFGLSRTCNFKNEKKEFFKFLHTKIMIMNMRSMLIARKKSSITETNLLFHKPVNKLNYLYWQWTLELHKIYCKTCK